MNLLQNMASKVENFQQIVPITINHNGNWNHVDRLESTRPANKSALGAAGEQSRKMFCQPDHTSAPRCYRKLLVCNGENWPIMKIHNTSSVQQCNQVWLGQPSKGWNSIPAIHTVIIHCSYGDVKEWTKRMDSDQQLGNGVVSAVSQSKTTAADWRPPGSTQSAVDGYRFMTYICYQKPFVTFDL